MKSNIGAGKTAERVRLSIPSIKTLLKLDGYKKTKCTQLPQVENVGPCIHVSVWSDMFSDGAYEFTEAEEHIVWSDPKLITGTTWDTDRTGKESHVCVKTTTLKTTEFHNSNGTSAFKVTMTPTHNYLYPIAGISHDMFTPDRLEEQKVPVKLRPKWPAISILQRDDPSVRGSHHQMQLNNKNPAAADEIAGESYFYSSQGPVVLNILVQYCTKESKTSYSKAQHDALLDEELDSQTVDAMLNAIPAELGLVSIADAISFSSDHYLSAKRPGVEREEWDDPTLAAFVMSTLSLAIITSFVFAKVVSSEWYKTLKWPTKTRYSPILAYK